MWAFQSPCLLQMVPTVDPPKYAQTWKIIHTPPLERPEAGTRYLATLLFVDCMYHPAPFVEPRLLKALLSIGLTSNLAPMR